MEKRDVRNPTLNAAAENIGAALGEVAARLDRWKKDQALIAADLQGLLRKAQEMLSELGDTATRGFNNARKGGRSNGSKTPPDTNAKRRAEQERRKASSPVKESATPVDQRGIIRSKASRTWSNRQPGRG